MINVISNGDSMTAVMAGAAATTNPTYSLVWEGDGGPANPVGSLNGATAVEMLAGVVGRPREVRSVAIYNGDTAAVVVTVNKKIGSTSYPICKVTLQVDDTLRIDDRGVHVIDSSGMSRIIRTGYKIQVSTRAKVGATAGWTVGAANDLGTIATLAASQTGSTLVLPIDGLHIGDTITAFKINAQVESAGGAVTIDAALRALTNAAADPTDAQIAAMTQVAVTADTAVASEKSGLTEVVTAGKTYYLLITATTALATDIQLLAPELTITKSD